jgi:23S rRNA (uracil1939-C5)-methyltransferase/tRNA (uracil-5-)-methyltransferase
MRIHIEKLIHGGSGMGHADGKAVFVPFAAPGDELDVEITADHKGFSEARILEVARPASCRVKPRCPVFGRCGGCQWQHMDYPEQLKWKREILAETLSRMAKVEDPNVLETLASPKEWHYRNRMMLHVDSKGRIGYYRARSKEVVEFDECFIAEEGLNEEMNRRREELGKRDRGIALRSSGEENFSQVNSGQNKNLKELLSEWLSEVPHSNVCELYAGSGNLTEAIARMAVRVVASEIDVRAVDAAAERLSYAGLGNVEFKRMAAEKVARRHAGLCDAVVIDPPRKGCQEAVEAIAEGGPISVIYISCDPATLARDVRYLRERGYELVKSRPVDMFPQTFHIESITMLKRS